MSTIHPLVLLLADARFPAGGHAHSGGLEAAAARGGVVDAAGLERFCRGRLATVGLTGAALAAAACGGVHPWAALDAEADARTPSPVLRASSRRLGRQLVRAGRRILPGDALASLSAVLDEPHQPVVLGALAAGGGLAPADAALVAAYDAISGPAGAAVRLLGLDPFDVHAVLAGLAPEVAAVATLAATHATGPLADLPARSSPLLDLTSVDHATWEVRLFAS